MLGSGPSWRVIVFDPMDIASVPFSYAPKNGVCSKQDAIANAHDYVDKKVGMELEQCTHLIKRNDEEADSMRAV